MCRQITDNGLKGLVSSADHPRNTQLQFLNLYDCGKLTDAGIDELKTACPKLHYLGLYGLDRLTTKGLANVLQNLKGVSHVDVGGCKLITPEHLEQLAKTFSYVRF